MRHLEEKGRVDQIRDTQRKLERVNEKIVIAQRARDTAQVADLLYGAVPDLTRLLERLVREKKSGAGMLSEVVGPNDVAEVVARWTGIPVSKLTSSDRERLLHLAEHLHERVVGQDEAVQVRVTPHVRLPLLHSTHRLRVLCRASRTPFCVRVEAWHRQVAQPASSSPG
jgi:ATP-dependent Clp protease ATP-binding subunit ClpA